MRVDDQAPPAVVVDDDPPPATWRGRLVIALERLPQAAYVWDDDPDVCWDDADPDRFVWDAPFVAEGFTDVWCDFYNLVVYHGEPDEADMFRLSMAQLELRDPGDGRYRSRTTDGRLVYYAPGRRLAIWWLDPDGEPWWVFSGQLTSWRERLDGTLGVEAWSGGRLGRPTLRDWTAGTDGQFPSQRIASILAHPVVAYPGPARLDLGDVTLSVPDAEAAVPIDVIRQVAWSDGGIVYTDADDTLVYRDRRWRNGRTDQTREVILTDNVCDADPAGIVIWEPEVADDDVRLAGTVRLVNDADPPLTATAAGSGLVDPALIYTHPGSDLWRAQAEGDALAAHTAAERSQARWALSRAVIYLHDIRHDYWAATLDTRVGDRARFQHQEAWSAPGDVIDVETIVTTVRHLVTPDSWLVELQTSPAVGYTAVELWDRTRFAWDDPDPLAVWR